MNLFFALTKVDAEQRLVYGVATAEELDKANEICDYETTKPYYEAWSSEIEKASGGKSLGNVREMHGKSAAGKLTQVVFNDDAKQIEVCAKVVDDGAWTKVQEGVYTGFSQGGKYVKRWKDESGQVRYTAQPAELSLVDNPCVKSATFSMVKADGVVEEVAFKNVDADALEKNGAGPGEKAKDSAASALEKSEAQQASAGAGDQTAAKPARRVPAQVWDCGVAGHSHVQKADAAKCIDHQDALAKAEEASRAAASAVDALKAALNPAAAAQDAAGEGAATGAAETSAEGAQAAQDATGAAAGATDAPAAATGGAADATQQAPGAAATDKPAEKADGADERKTILITAGGDLAKGIYSVRNLAALVQELCYVCCDAQYEAEYEGDDSPLPAKLRDAVKVLAGILVEMTQEEVAELVAALPGPKAEVIVENAARALDLVKTLDAAALEKAVADQLVPLRTVAAEFAGVALPEGADDVAKLTEERDALTKRFDELAAQLTPIVETVTTLQKTIGDQAAEIQKLKDAPAAPKAVTLHVVGKAADGGAAGTGTSAPGGSGVDAARAEFEKSLAGMSPQQRAHELMKAALSNPVPIKDEHPHAKA